MISLQTTLMGTFGSILFLFFIIELIRKERLKEQYSIFWLFSSIVLLLFSIFNNSIIKIMSILLGVYEPANAFFLILFFCMIIILLHFSVVISKLSNQNKILLQKLSILELKFSKLKNGN